MEIKLDSKFSVNGLYVQGSLHLRRGLNVLCGNNGIGKSTLFHYIKNNKA